VAREATEDEEGLEVRTCRNDSSHTEERSIPKMDPDRIIYRAVSGDGSSWTKGSNVPLALTFRRSVNDERTFSRFKGIRIDGKDLAGANYTAEAGGVIIRLKPEYLDTLSEGKHSLTALFTDGNKSAGAEFTIKAAAEDAASAYGPAYIPAKTKITGVRSSKKKAAVSFRRVRGNISGYQIAVKDRKTGRVRIVYAKKNSKKTITKTVKGLRKNTRYSVRVRAYCTDGTMTYCAPWSKARSFRTK
jgi:hypothetical protein